MTPDQQKASLYSAVTSCDAMLVQAEVDDARERCEVRGHTGDAARIARYSARRSALVAQRKELEALYESLYGENPWSDVAF